MNTASQPSSTRPHRSSSEDKPTPWETPPPPVRLRALAAVGSMDQGPVCFLSSTGSQPRLVPHCKICLFDTVISLSLSLSGLHDCSRPQWSCCCGVMGGLHTHTHTHTHREQVQRTPSSIGEHAEGEEEFSSPVQDLPLESSPQNNLPPLVRPHQGEQKAAPPPSPPPPPARLEGSAGTASGAGSCRLRRKSLSSILSWLS